MTSYKITLKLFFNKTNSNSPETDEFFDKVSIEKYVKSKFSAKDMLEFVGYGDYRFDEKSFQWNEDFSLSYIITPNVEWDDYEVLGEFSDIPLEDAEYESCVENGWLIMTKDDSYLEYGRLDFRRDNCIIVTEC